MGTKHVIRYGRNPKEETMKYIILASLLVTACAHTTTPDPKKCCERLSLHQQEMEKFTRYCKVALFLYRGNTINDKKVKASMTKGEKDTKKIADSGSKMTKVETEPKVDYVK